MPRYLLDTNIVIHVMKRRPLQALEYFNQHVGRMAILAITLAKLIHGAEKSGKPPFDPAVVDDSRSRHEVLPHGAKAARHNGSIRVTPNRAAKSLALTICTSPRMRAARG